MDVRCASCNHFFPIEHTIQEGTGYYCKKCHKQASGQKRASKTSKNELKCAGCARDLNSHRVIKVQIGNKIYCENCYPSYKNEELIDINKENYDDTVKLFKCLGDPCRVKILEFLSLRELCVYEFVDITGFQYNAISYHLKVLKDMGLVSSCEKGNFMVYSLTDKGKIIHEFVKKSRDLK